MMRSSRATDARDPNMTNALINPPNRIRELRTARGLTLLNVADQLHTSQTQISRFETGERTINLDWLQRIAKALDTNVGELLNSIDNSHAARTPSERALIDLMRVNGEPFADLILDLANAVQNHMGQQKRIEDETDGR